MGQALEADGHLALASRPSCDLGPGAAQSSKAGHVRDNIEVPTYRDEAVVLRTHKLGEADRIITMLSRHRGKIRAVAKGVRRTTSKFGARLEPFSHIDLQLAVGHPGRDHAGRVAGCLR